MRWSVFPISWVLAGCPSGVEEDDSGASAQVSGSTSSSVSTTGSTTSGTATSEGPQTSTSTDSSTGSITSSGAVDASSTGDSGGAQGVTLEGDVASLWVDLPRADATVSWWADPRVTATTDREGHFTLEPLPLDVVIDLVVSPQIDAWGSLDALATGPDPLLRSVALRVVEHELIDVQEQILQQQDPQVAVDRNAGILIVGPIQPVAAEAGVTVELDPPALADTYFAANLDGLPLLNANVAANVILPVVVFFNLDDSSRDEITVTATHPERVCEVLGGVPPVSGGHVTFVDLDCPAT